MSNTTFLKDESPFFETSPQHAKQMYQFKTEHSEITTSPNKPTMLSSKARLAPLKGAPYAPSDKLVKFFTPTNKNEWNWQNLTLQRSVESQNKAIFK